jgi:3-deoxy-manno-octulosonate cytidylyltransferase (CMP-KDO synthetase)
MNIVAVIPARMNASRFPNKPMELLLGMPMIGHCYHRTSIALGASNVYVATCDQVIIDYIESIGGQAVMTSAFHDRAVTRTAEAVEVIENTEDRRIDVAVMVQGDEPIISPIIIKSTLPHFDDEAVQMVNIMSEIGQKEVFYDRNNVKVVFDHNFNALYFSREPIPSPWKGWEQLPKYMQTGIIAFRRESLINFNQMPETALEKYESVDMNRILEAGGSIRMVATSDFTLGVDTKEELELAEKFLKTDIFVQEYI